MTEHDLSTLVRDHVSSDEPPFAGPEHAIVRGRRTVRTRRLAAGVGVAAVLAVAGAVVVPQLGDSSGTDGAPNGIDPATQEALDNYDAEAMPEILDEAARSVFSRSVSGLGPSEFSASSDDGVVLEAGDYDKAGGMSVTFGTREHEWRVSIIHSGSDAEGDHQKACEEDLRAGSYLACTVKERGDGVWVIDRVIAWQKAGPEWGWGLVAPDELERYPSDILWFEHEEKVIKSGSFITYTSERVKAPSLAAAEQEFLVPVEDLAALGADPELVIPQPDDYGDNTGRSVPAKMPSPPPAR